MKFLQTIVVFGLVSVVLPFAVSAQEILRQAAPAVAGGNASLTPQTESGSLEQLVAGGYSTASVTDPNVVTAANVAVKGAQYRLSSDSNGAPQKLKLLAILSAEQQVVAGVNYRLKLQVSHNGRVRQAETIVLWQSWSQLPFETRSWAWL